MKILYVITKSNWGGAQKNVFDLAIEMKKRGYNVSVALGGDGILRKKLGDEGVKTYSINELGRDVNISKDTASFNNIFSIIRREKPDILHLHSPKAAGLGAFAGRILRVKKIIITVHGFTFNEDRPLMQKLSIMFFSWITALLVHEMIILSEREYAQAMYFPWTKDKLNLISLGMTNPVFMSIDGSKQVLSKAANITISDWNKKFVIGTVAELHPNKGLTYLINAMEQVAVEHPNVLGLIIGDGQEKDNLNALISQKNLQDHVKLLGRMEDASQYLKSFNLFVLSSVKEGLPYTLIEAGYASLPVISTTVGGIPEIIEDMKSGVLVQPKNSRELAHSLSFMIDHPNMRRQYGAALRASVIEKFSMDKMLNEVELLYTS